MTFSLFITVPRGLETVLAAEVGICGGKDAVTVPGGVSCQGTLECAYRLCLWSRTAGKVLLTIHRFSATTLDDAFEAAHQLDWSEHLGPKETLAVHVTDRSRTPAHTLYAAQRIKDAIVDQFRETTGKRPSVDLGRPDVRIHLHRDELNNTLSIDLAGDSLHRRGYRMAAAGAPIKENLAAGLLLQSGWQECAASGGSLVDPFVGSGTFVIEAALIAANVAPGLLRSYFGFLGWRGHQPALWRTLTDEAREYDKRRSYAGPPLFGFDNSAGSLALARKSLQRAGVSSFIHLGQRAVRELRPPVEASQGLIVGNPPYGVRVGQGQALELLYAQLGDVLKHHFGGWRAHILVGDHKMARSIGLRPERRHVVFNGAIECRWLDFHIRPLATPVTDTENTDRGRSGVKGPAEMFANRLQKNLKHLSRWAEREDVHCYRIYDADLPEFAFAIDRYEQWVYVQEYAPPASIDIRQSQRRRRLALTALAEVLGAQPEDVFFRSRARQRRGSQYGSVGPGDGQMRRVSEGGLTFWVNLERYLDTGLFLEQRSIRQLIQKMAKGRRFLNLFAYTATATIYAANGGAVSTTSVDLSPTYLRWASKNFAVNHLAKTRHELAQADILTWLPSCRKRFDLILMDAPTFSNSRRTSNTLDLQRDHPHLIREAVRCLDRAGVLIFSTHAERFRIDEEALASFDVRDISALTLPPDFRRHPKIHHVWEIRRRAEF